MQVEQIPRHALARTQSDLEHVYRWCTPIGSRRAVFSKKRAQERTLLVPVTRLEPLLRW
jgi:hypothetical protein